MTIFLACLTKAEKKDKEKTTTKLNVMRDLVHLIVFSYNTQSSKKDWKERHRVTTTFYMVHVVHFYFFVFSE